jgi:hypothetical protein
VLKVRCETSRILLTALDDRIYLLQSQHASDASERDLYNAARNTAFFKASNPDLKKDRNFSTADQDVPPFLPPGYDQHPRDYVDTGRL